MGRRPSALEARREEARGDAGSRPLNAAGPANAGIRSPELVPAASRSRWLRPEQFCLTNPHAFALWNA